MKSCLTTRPGQSQTIRNLVAILCVLLILFVGAAQALHVHNAADEAANPGCALCAVAHVSALPTPVLAHLLVAETVAPIVAVDPVAAPRRFFSFSLYTRPPPAVLTAHA